MDFEVTRDRNKWKDYYNKLSDEKKDIYFTDDYYFLHEANGDGYAYAALYKSASGAIIIYPFLLIQIKCGDTNTKYYDIESCYGYGGPISDNCHVSDIEGFEDAFGKWCIEKNIVSEFIRFHPLLGNHILFKNKISVEENRQTVYIDLDGSDKAIWEGSISSKNRNMIRKAKRLGVTTRLSSDWETFKRIYKTTMERVDAGEYYFFKEAYFMELAKFSNKLFILEAVLENRVIASSIFLYSKHFLNYHLSGSDPNYLSCAPNNLLLYDAAMIGKTMGIKKMHLGGGTSNTEVDSLLKFKKSFSKQTSAFYIGKRVYNRLKYDSLMNQWVERTGTEPVLFHQYHF